jgi:selenide,water dikinase
MFEGVLSLIDAGAVPGGTERNVAAAAAYASWSAGVSNTLRTALADAQTSGGLLMAVASTAAASLLADLHAIDVEASEVGEICDGVPGTIAIEHDD